MTPARFDFYLPTNGDYVEEITFAVNGQPIDLTNITFGAQIRLAYDSPNIEATLLTTGSAAEQGFYRIEPAGGVLQVRINREIIASMYAAAVPAAYTGRTINLPYDALVTQPNGDIENWFEGYMILNKGVTQ